MFCARALPLHFPTDAPGTPAFLLAFFTDGAVLSQSSGHCDRRQPPGPFSFPGSLARGDSRAPRAMRPPRRSAAWTCTARWGKVRPLECPEPPASGTPMVERLARAACRAERADRPLTAKPPAYVPRALADTRVLACDRGYTCGRPRFPMAWCGCRVDGGFASGVYRATC